MKTLGNYYHDFPKLAKQTGYFFQLYRGKVNWNELENLNLDDITKQRNFQLLEQNLINVINCNLEKEYDLRTLDRNLVKLFKIAQLGIDYLSFCELYLDKCVILLQKKLIAFQEKCEFLKQENEKKNEELKKRKKKTSSSIYQCEKCEKFFISEFYLKGHDKRRHSNPTTSNISTFKRPAKKQRQNEEKLNPIFKMSEKQNYLKNDDVEEGKKLECDNLIKIKHLEKNLEELENRLTKAESASLKTSSIYSFPSSQLMEMFYSQTQPNITSSFSHSEISCLKKNECLDFVKSFPKFLTFDNSSALKLTDIKIAIPQTLQKLYTEIKISNSQKRGEKNFLRDENFQIFEKKFSENCSNTSLEIEDESSSNCSFSTYQTKFKDLTSPNLKSKILLSFFDKNHESKSSLKESDSASVYNDFLRSGEEQSKKSMHQVDINKISPNNFTSEGVRKLNYKIVKKKNKEKSFVPQNLNKIFKNSLSDLFHLVFLNQPNIILKENEIENIKKIAEDKLNQQLKTLGVDPEWKSLPKKTMIQSLKSLKQQQKFFAKKNSMYSTVRKTLEKWISKKFEENFKEIITEEKKTSKLKDCKVIFDHSLKNLESTKKNVKPFQKIMYNIDTESESELEIEKKNSN